MYVEVEVEVEVKVEIEVVRVQDDIARRQLSQGREE
jgi:hypothetical protein